MKLTDALLGEHGLMYALFDHVEKELSDLSDLGGVQQLTRGLAAALVSHARVENELLFPALEQQIGPAGPVAVMRREHDLIERSLDEVAAAADFDAALEALRRALQVCREHFAKEEQILFLLARRSIPAEDLELLGRHWADTRQVIVR